MSRTPPKYHPLLSKIKSLAGYIRMVSIAKNPTEQQIGLAKHHADLLVVLKQRWCELRLHMHRKADKERVKVILSETGKEAFNIGRLKLFLRRMKQEMTGDYTEAEREYLETRRREKTEIYTWAIGELEKRLKANKFYALEAEIGFDGASAFYRKIKNRSTIWRKDKPKVEFWLLRLEQDLPIMSDREKEVALSDIEFLKNKLAEFAEFERQKRQREIIKRKNKARRKRDRIRARERGIKPKNSAIDDDEYISARVAIKRSGRASLIFELSKIRKSDRFKNWQKRMMLKNLIKRANAESYV